MEQSSAEHLVNQWETPANTKDFAEMGIVCDLTSLIIANLRVCRKITLFSSCYICHVLYKCVSMVK